MTEPQPKKTNPNWLRQIFGSLFLLVAFFMMLGTDVKATDDIAYNIGLLQEQMVVLHTSLAMLICGVLCLLIRRAE